MRCNAFTNVATGDNLLFETLSRANHSCVPNMRYTFEGDVAVVSMLRDAAQAEELTISCTQREPNPAQRGFV